MFVEIPFSGARRGTKTKQKRTKICGYPLEFFVLRVEITFSGARRDRSEATSYSHEKWGAQRQCSLFMGSDFFGFFKINVCIPALFGLRAEKFGISQTDASVTKYKKVQFCFAPPPPPPFFFLFCTSVLKK